MKKHEESKVIQQLSRKHDVKIGSLNKTVVTLSGDSNKAQHDLGNGSWGKIDFLKNHCGYRHTVVSEF